MATIETKPRRDGTTAYRVRFRVKPGSNPTVETFNTAGEAATFAALVDRIGGEAARAKRNAAAGASTRTLTDALDSYIQSAPDIAASTAAEYRRILTRSGIDTHLGLLPIDLIEREDVEAWVRARSQSGPSPKTIRNEHGLLSTLLGHAVDRGWIPTNPAKGVRLPKAHRPEMDILTEPEFLRLHAAMTDRYKPLVWLLGATGLRWGEATALQWRDIEGTQITVRRAWKHSDDGNGRVLGEPKTQRGRRRIETTQAVIDSLGERGKADEFVFTNAQGRPIVYHTFHKSHWTPACKAANLSPAPKVHGLRHFAASYMLAQGADIFEVSRALGHTDISTTTGVYGHLVPSRTRPTAVHAARMDGLLAAQLEASAPDAGVPSGG